MTRKPSSMSVTHSKLTQCKDAVAVENDHSPKSHLGLAVLACVQNACVGGVLYGWASIDRTMLAASTADGGAALNLDETTRIFSWASSAALVSTIFLGGYVLDRFGPRVCSIVSHVVIGSGCYMFSISTTFWQYAIAASLITMGGPGIQLSIINFANTFPHNQFLAMSILNGTICISFAIFTLFDLIWSQFGVSFRTLFMGLCLLTTISMVATYRYYPDKSFEISAAVAAETKKLNTDLFETSQVEKYAEEITSHTHLIEQPLDSYLRDSKKDHFDRSVSYILSKKAIQAGDEEYISLKDRPFNQQLCSGSYGRLLLVFLVTSFLANFYIASFSTEMTDLQQFDSSVQHNLAQILTLMMTGGIFSSLVAGWIMDRVGLEICTVLTLFLGQLQLIILTYHHQNFAFMIFSFVLYVFFRQFTYTVFIAMITSTLGYKYFGLLNGAGFALSGITQFLMPTVVMTVNGTCHLEPIHLASTETSFGYSAGVQTFCDHGNWIMFHKLEVFMLMLLYVIPMLDYKFRLRNEEEAQRYVEKQHFIQPLTEYDSFQSSDEEMQPL